jgi:hypothetical protein
MGGFSIGELATDVEFEDVDATNVDLVDYH